jgi:predicted acyl esterase
MCFFNLDELTHLKENESFSTLKTRIFWKQSYQKVTQFSMCNTALHVCASNTDNFLQQIHVFLQGLSGGNKAYLYLVSPNLY